MGERRVQRGRQRDWRPCVARAPMPTAIATCLATIDDSIVPLDDAAPGASAR